MHKTHGRQRQAPNLAALILMLMLAHASVAQAQSDHSQWSAFVTVRHSEELDRVRNDEPFPDRIWNGADTGLTFSTRTERSLFGFFGRVGANVYDDPLFEDQVTYGGGFSWDYRASSRSSMSLTQTFNKNLRLDTLSNLGVVPNDFDTTSATTSWSFQQQSGPRTSWSLGLGYQFIELSNRVPIEPSQLVLDESPFGDELSIPEIDTTAPTEVDLPNGEDEILRILATEGLSDPTARQQSAFASFGLNHAIGQYTSIGFNVNGGYRDINTSVAGDGPMSTAQFFLQRALSVSNAVSVAYTFQRSFVIDPNTTIQTVFGGWSYSNDNSSFAATLFGGASRYSAEGSSPTTQPVANASLSGELTASTTASVSYRRQFSMPLGFGRSLLMDYAHANLSQNLGSRVNVSVTAGGSFGSDPLEEDSTIDTRRAGASGSVRIIAGLSLGATYFYVENEQFTSNVGFDETYHTWSAYLTYSADF